MSFSQGPALTLKAGVTLWMLILSTWDLRRHRVPNVLVLPVMLGALLWRLYFFAAEADSSCFFVLISWVILFMLWQGHILGGGDAKVLMVLFAMFPTLQFLVMFSIVKLLVTLPLVVAKYWGRRPGDLLQSARERAQAKQLLPDEHELRTSGQSNIWSYCLSGVVYLWWLL